MLLDPLKETLVSDRWRSAACSALISHKHYRPIRLGWFGL